MKASSPTRYHGIRLVVAGLAAVIATATCARRGEIPLRGMDAVRCPNGERFARVRNYTNGAIELVTTIYGGTRPPEHLALISPSRTEEFVLADSVMVRPRATSASELGAERLRIEYFCRAKQDSHPTDEEAARSGRG